MDSSFPVPGDQITADFGQLRGLAADLRALAREIADRDSILHSAVADPDLTADLHAAERDWTTHRRALASFLDDAATSIQQCLGGYQRLERKLVQAGTISH
jgi:hypothetical protein